jgi:hypothetical protein
VAGAAVTSQPPLPRQSTSVPPALSPPTPVILAPPNVDGPGTVLDCHERHATPKTMRLSTMPNTIRYPILTEAHYRIATSYDIAIYDTIAIFRTLVPSCSSLLDGRGCAGIGASQLWAPTPAQCGMGYPLRFCGAAVLQAAGA